MKQVVGVPYLYDRDGRYTVRVQVPKELREQLNKGVLKQSLGGDLIAAKRECHSVIAGFLDQIEAARHSNVTVSSEPMSVGRREIELAVRAHYRRMALHIAQAGDSDRQQKMRNLNEVIDVQLSINAAEAWSALSLEAAWLCEEYGWQMDESGSEFEFLCEAMSRAKVQAYRDEIRRLQGIRSADPEADPMLTADISTNQADGTLGDLIDQFKAEKELNWSISTKSNYAIIFRVLEEICGRETALTEVDRKFCFSIRETLLRLPSNYQKKRQTKGLPIKDAIMVGERLGLPKMLPATINSHLSKLAAIVKLGRNSGKISGNPMADILVADDVRPEDKRDPFTIRQLNQIFSSPPWCDGLDAAHQSPSRYWGPLIALFSGARLSEIFGQLVEEVIEKEGTLLFDFRHRKDTRPMKWKKSRVVPVHPFLIELGFNKFVEQARQSGRELLFPDAKRDSRGKWGDATSDWFARKIVRLKLKGRNLSFHSLRHSFEDALREADLHDTALGNQIVGRWTAGTSKNYGSNFSTAKLTKAVSSVAYPGLDLSHLLPGK